MEEKQKSMRVAADIVRAASNPAAWMYPPFRSIMSIFMDKVSQVKGFPREVKDENGELIGLAPVNSIMTLIIPIRMML